MSTYNIRISNAMVKVDMVDHPGLLDVKLSEFRKSLQRRVVGINAGSYINSFSYQQMVMIDLHRMANPLPESFRNFLTDETICFVGLISSEHLTRLQNRGVECKTGVDVGYLVTWFRR
ncbi:Ribonuclease H-like domain containing protein [Trema orientale]|uniref:Ribonuclease H-like domain containing protein n=1 Tax=Trema orientale TaxID=63057 RepID=A0A2P5E801_TREOI|nr:Ribonuclease H-like domain containing protein [Trema orientale]